MVDGMNRKIDDGYVLSIQVMLHELVLLINLTITLKKVWSYACDLTPLMNQNLRLNLIFEWYEWITFVRNCNYDFMELCFTFESLHKLTPNHKHNLGTTTCNYVTNNIGDGHRIGSTVVRTWAAGERCSTDIAQRRFDASTRRTMARLAGGTNVDVILKNWNSADNVDELIVYHGILYVWKL